jgi:hypothetical protein
VEQLLTLLQVTLLQGILKRMPKIYLVPESQDDIFKAQTLEDEFKLKASVETGIQDDEEITEGDENLEDDTVQ